MDVEALESRDEHFALPLPTDFPSPPSARIVVLEASSTARMIEYPLSSEVSSAGCGLLAAAFAIPLASTAVVTKDWPWQAMPLAFLTALATAVPYFYFLGRHFVGARCRITMRRSCVRIDQIVQGKTSVEDFPFEGKGEAKLFVTLVYNDLPLLAIEVRCGRRRITLGGGLSNLEQTWLVDRLNEVLDPESRSTINHVELAPPQDPEAAEKELRKTDHVEVSRQSERTMRIAFPGAMKQFLPVLPFLLIGVGHLVFSVVWLLRLLVGRDGWHDLMGISFAIEGGAVFTAFGFYAWKGNICSLEVDEEGCVTRAGIPNLRYTRRLPLQKIAQLSTVITRSPWQHPEMIHQVLCLLSDGKEIHLSTHLSKSQARAVASLVHTQLASMGREILYIERAEPASG